MLSGRVYLFVCVIEMGMDMHTCFVFAHTCDFKREEKQRERDIFNTHVKSLYLESQYMCMIYCVRVFVHTLTKAETLYRV